MATEPTVMSYDEFMAMYPDEDVGTVTPVEETSKSNVLSYDEFMKMEDDQESVVAAELPDMEPTYQPPSVPSIGVDMDMVQSEEAKRSELAQEFGWLDNPFKSKDPYVQDIMDQMAMVWRSTEMSPSQQLERLRKLKTAAQSGMTAAASITEREAEAAPTTRERMFTEESASDDVLRTLGSAGTAELRMLNAVGQGITEIVTLGYGGDWFQKNEDELASKAAGVLAEITEQGGEAAAIAQTIGEQALVTAIRLVALGKLPKSTSKIIGIVRLGAMTAITEPGSLKKRLKAAGRMMLLSSTPYPAKTFAAWTGASPAWMPVVTGAFDAGLNVGLSNLFSFYDWDNPRSWIPALITDIAFAGGTTADLRAQYKVQVGAKQAATDFKKAETAREERESVKTPEARTAEETIRETEAEINRLVSEELAVKPAEGAEKLLLAKTAISKPVAFEPEPTAKPITEMDVKLTGPEAEPGRLDMTPISKIDTRSESGRTEANRLLQETNQFKAGDIIESPQYTLSGGVDKTFRVESVNEDGRLNLRALETDRPMTSDQFTRGDKGLESQWSKVGAEAKPEAAPVAKPEPKVAPPPARPTPKKEGVIPSTSTRAGKGAEVAKVPAKVAEVTSDHAVKKAEAKLVKAGDLVAEDTANALVATVEAMRELERPATAKELNTMPTAKLKKLAKQYGIPITASNIKTIAEARDVRKTKANLEAIAKERGVPVTGVRKEPARSELIKSIERAQKREAQYDEGIDQPISNLSDRQRVINNTLGVSKPMTPQEREDYAHRVGAAEGELVGQIRGVKAGIKEGMLTKGKAIKQALRENKKTVEIFKSSLKSMAKSLTTEDRLKLAKSVAEVKTFEQYQKVATKIQDKLETGERKTMLTEIGDIAKRVRRERVTPEIKAEMTDEMLASLGLKAQSDFMKSISESVDKDLAALGITDPTNAKQISKALEAQAKGMSLDQLSALRDNLAILAAASDKTVEAKIVKEDERKTKVAESAVKGVAKAAPISGLTFGKSAEGRLSWPYAKAAKTSKGIRSMLLNFWTREKMLDAGSDRGEHWKEVGKPLLEGTRISDEITLKSGEVKSRINDIVSERWGKQKTSVDVGGKSIPMTHNEKISLYLTSLRKMGLKDLTTTGLKRRGAGEKEAKFKTEDIDKLWQSMTDQELFVATELAKGMKENLTPAQRKAYIDLNHHDIPGLEDFYWRTFAEPDFVKEGKSAVDYNVENVGFLKPKTGGRPILINDAIETFSKLTQQTARYAGFAKPMRNIKALLNDADYQKAVTEKFGSDFLDEFRQHIQNIEGKAGPESKIERVLLGGLRNVATSYINVNPSTIAKQLPSMINVLDYGVPMKYWLRNVNTIVPKEELFRNPTIKRRFTEQLMERETSEAFAAKGVLQKTRRKLGYGIKTADKLAISRAYASIKDWLASEKGLKGDELLRETQDSMSEIIAKTQPTSDALNQTLLQAQKGLVPKSVTLFSSQRSKLNNMLMGRAVELVNAKTPEAKKDAAKKFGTMSALYVGNATAMSLIGMGIHHGWRKLLGKKKEPEAFAEEMAGRMIKNFMGMMPGGRELYTAGKLLSDKGPGGLKQGVRMGYFDSALSSGFTDVVKMVDVFDSDKEMVERIGALVTGVDRILGLGVSVPVRYVKEALTPEKTMERWLDSNWRMMKNSYRKGKKSLDDIGEWIKFSDLKEKEEKYTDRLFDLVADEVKTGKIPKTEATTIINKYATTTSQKIKALKRITKYGSTMGKEEID